MGIGILAGLALSGPAAQAATTITATLSNQPIYVDGQRVSMTAYNIGDNNYVRLRDIGRAVDFGVTYDAATNSVHIDSKAHYQEEVTVTGITEESVQARCGD
ncbi:MAG: copper amine oxidase N-terminal domain-containing protein [Oscillospiraceae bacterium]|nr:copper amine oxidase N-terminal domain-containing protein [Oscillospiraceae bacterium]